MCVSNKFSFDDRRESHWLHYVRIRLKSAMQQQWKNRQTGKREERVSHRGIASAEMSMQVDDDDEWPRFEDL